MRPECNLLLKPTDKTYDMNLSLECRSLDMDKVPSACPCPRSTATAAALLVLIAEQGRPMLSKCLCVLRQNVAHERAIDALAQDHS